MHLHINIETRHFTYLLIAVAIIATIGIAIAQVPNNPGHPFSQIDCSGCIGGSELADGAVTEAKIASGAVTELKIADSAVTDAKINDVAWTKVSGAPAGLDDGDDNDMTTCDWAGPVARSITENQGCASCCGSNLCSGTCQQSRIVTLTTTCTSGVLTGMSNTAGSWGACGCTGTCVYIVCFASETLVSMASGEGIQIQNISVGDVVLGLDGSNEVLGIRSHPIGSGIMYSINGKVVVTNDHPFLTTEGWKIISRERFDGFQWSISDVGQLKVGDVLVTEDGSEIVESIEVAGDRQPEEMIYDLEVSGDGTYVANGYVVHME